MEPIDLSLIGIGDQIKDAEKSISELIELVVGARNARVVSAYEKKIEEQEADSW